jgi:hypothetical protein
MVLFDPCVSVNFAAYPLVSVTIVLIMELSKYNLKASDALLTDRTEPLISENWILLEQ